MINQSPENEDFLFRPAQGEASVGTIWDAAQDVTMTLMESQFQRMARDEAAKIGKKLTREEAESRFPGLGADREISEGEAQYLYDWKKEREEKQRLIDTASDSFLKGTVLPLVAGAAKSFTDPSELILGLLTGGIGNGLKVGASLGKKISIDFLEAGLSQTIAEAPIMAETNESFEEYTAKQFAQNALLASVMQIGIQYGGSAAFRGVGKALRFAGEKTSQNLLELQMRLESQGVNSTGIMNTLIKDIQGMYEDVNIAKDVVSRNFPELQIEKAENIEDLLNPVLDMYRKGDIDDAALESFTRDAMESGVNPQAMKRMIEDSPIEFSDDIVEQVKREANDYKNTHGFEDRFDQEIDQLTEDTIESFEGDISTTYREAIENLPEEAMEDIVDIGDGSTMKMREFKEVIDKQKNSQEFLKDYASCIRGVG